MLAKKQVPKRTAFSEASGTEEASASRRSRSRARQTRDPEKQRVALATLRRSGRSGQRPSHAQTYTAQRVMRPQSERPGRDSASQGCIAEQTEAVRSGCRKIGEKCRFGSIRLMFGSCQPCRALAASGKLCRPPRGEHAVHADASETPSESPGCGAFDWRASTTVSDHRPRLSPAA